MKLEIIKNKLKDVVSMAERATGKNLSLPILSSILIEARNNTVIIKSTNLDIGLEIETSAKIIEEGSVAVNANVLNAYLGNLVKEDKVKIELVKENLHISTNSSSTLIKCFSSEDFPMIPQVEEAPAFNLNSKDLSLGLKSVIYAASISDIKPEIASVFIYQDDKDLVFVATDSFRLAEKRINLKSDNKEFQPIIIPIKNVAEIIKVFDSVDEDLVVKSNKNQISFLTDNIHLTSRVIDGNFPDYKQLMPNKFKTEVVLAKSELVDALKLSNIFADKFNQININISPSKKTFEINSQNQDVGENSISVTATLEGEDLDMSFNAKYFLDVMQTVNSDTIALKLNEKNRPLLLSGVGDRSFRYLIMPINR